MVQFFRHAGLGLAAIFAAFQLSACSDSSEQASGPWYTPEEGSAARIAYDMGVLEYLNSAEPIKTSTVGDTTTYTFDQADGPSCMRGKEYRTAIRETDSKDLLIFMQGGGACWSDFCLAVINAPSGIPTSANLLNPNLEENPVKDWNVVYLPYCDGSLFVGDNVIREADGRDRIHAGLQNTSASLSMAYRHFPAPERILLAGSSGGGFGTIMVTYLVRYVWPEVPIYVINDSGVGIAHDGNRGFIDTLISEFNASRFIPKDCPTCGDNGHITDLVDYMLERDDNLTIGVFSSWYDGVIVDMFLKADPASFQESMARITGAINEKHPESYKRFILNGTTHTTLLGNVMGIVGNDIINGVELPEDMGGSLGSIKIGSLKTSVINDMNMGQWIDAMLNDPDNWHDLQEEPVLPDDGEEETP